MSDHLLLRSAQSYLVDHSGARGERHLLSYGDLTLPVINRVGYKHLRPGWYDVEHAWWTSRSGRKARAIRILGEYSAGRMYFHAANKPSELEGCYAPGLARMKVGVQWSRPAIGVLLLAMGGFEDGKRFRLEVV